MTIGERVSLLRKASGLSQLDFGKRIGASASYVCQLESGKCGLSRMAEKAICAEFEINPVWLRTGDGDMRSAPIAKDGDALVILVSHPMSTGEFHRMLHLMCKYGFIPPDCL